MIYETFFIAFWKKEVMLPHPYIFNSYSCIFIIMNKKILIIQQLKIDNNYTKYR